LGHLYSPRSVPAPNDQPFILVSGSH